MHHTPSLNAVKPGITGDGLGMVKLQDETAVGLNPFFRVLTELCHLPQLALILAQVLNHKGLNIRNGEEALAGGVDGDAPQVSGDPAAIRFFRNYSRSTAAGKAVKNQVAFI